jgi:hypothetical protein
MATRPRSSQTTLDLHNIRLTAVEVDVSEIKASMRDIASGVDRLNTAFAQNQGATGKIPVGVLTTCATIFLGIVTISSSLVLFAAQSSINPLRERFEGHVIDVRADLESTTEAQIEGERRATERIERLEARLWDQQGDIP